jgi:hypothetical protein
MKLLNSGLASWYFEPLASSSKKPFPLGIPYEKQHDAAMQRLDLTVGQMINQSEMSKMRRQNSLYNYCC